MQNTALCAESYQKKPWVHKTIRKRWDDIFRGVSTISLIERWADENYNPLAIPVKQYDTQHEHIIAAELTGYESTDVSVDVRRGCLIILATHGIGDSEHYAEIPLPNDINQQVVELEFRDGILTASFRKTTLGSVALKLTLWRNYNKSI